MAPFLAIVYIGGWLGTVMVDRYRVGVTQFGRVPLATMLTSLPWFVTTLGKMLVWPIVLVVWLVGGRPASPWEATTSSNGVLTVRRRARSV